MLRTGGTIRVRPRRYLWQATYSTRGDREETPAHDYHSTPTHRNTAAPEIHTVGHVPGQTQAQSSPSSSPPIDIGVLRSTLRDWGVLASSSLRRHAGQLSEKATTTFSHLGLHLNRVTGYEEIDALKKQVVEQEAQIKATRRAAREAKIAYDEAVLQRSISQRQVNDLLQRKSSWTDTDVSNFTSLVRSDHSFEQDEARAKAHVAETEDAVDREFSELMRVILARYHEEQVWSDKIRSASTYGSLAVLGVNVVVFIMAIIVVEPWKRKRLAQTFEKKVEEMGAEIKVLVGTGATRLEERLSGHEKLLTELVAQVTAEAPQELSAAAPAPEASPEETPVPPLPSSWWSQVYLSYPQLGAFRGRELVLVAGSAAAGGLVTLLTQSICKLIYCRHS